MASSCPYCGAVLKLKFCVVCGRQGKQNKMGQIRGSGRSHDSTTRMQDIATPEDNGPSKSLRFRRVIKPYIMAALGGTMVGVLLYCAAKEAINLYITAEVSKIILPWMKTHHVSFPVNWPGNFIAESDPKRARRANIAKKHGTSFSQKKSLALPKAEKH